MFFVPAFQGGGPPGVLPRRPRGVLRPTGKGPHHCQADEGPKLVGVVAAKAGAPLVGADWKGKTYSQSPHHWITKKRSTNMDDTVMCVLIVAFLGFETAFSGEGARVGGNACCS